MGGGGISPTPRPPIPPGKDPVPTVQEAGWTPGPVWTGGKSRPHRDSIPDRPARSQSLYRLSYRAHPICIYKYRNLYLLQLFSCEDGWYLTDIYHLSFIFTNVAMLNDRYYEYTWGLIMFRPCPSCVFFFPQTQLFGNWMLFGHHVNMFLLSYGVRGSCFQSLDFDVWREVLWCICEIKYHQR